VFATASAERPALYFTVVGEPPLKMLRYQQQMAFFDPEKVGTVIRFVDLSHDLLNGDLAVVLEKIVQHVQQNNPGIVIVDSFRTVVRGTLGVAGDHLELQAFLQKLAIHLTSWQVTSFLVGEYGETEMADNPVLTIADGIIWLSQSHERNSSVRKMEVIKVRGLSSAPGLHTFRISSEGITIFPRTTSRLLQSKDGARFISKQRALIGVPALDEMLGGGLPTGDATLIAGPSGTGKTVLATHFIAEGVKSGEPGVVAIFEEHPEDYLARAKDIGFDLEEMAKQNKLKVLYLRPLDLSADEILHRVQEAVAEIGATRLVIDSLNGLELALAPTFRDDFRESLYRLIGRLTGGGVSIVLTIEVMEMFTEIKFSPHEVSFLAQNIFFLRYIEIEGRLRRVLAIIKMRRSAHSHDLCEYEITSGGLRLLAPLSEYEGILRGVPTRRIGSSHSPALGVTQQERKVLEQLTTRQEATVADLARATGLASGDLSQALARLLQLNYVIEVLDDGQTTYRLAERPLGSG
jgi:circadian clock protein KaiC